jgi:DNA mismatch endonuclease (patch repair protein)
MQLPDQPLVRAGPYRVRKSPSFKGLEPSSEASSRAMRGNRKYDTKPELLLRRELWRLGLRFRRHARGLPGQPDIVFPFVRVAVFCDGDFWHGRNWSVLRGKLQRRANAPYWIAKIEANMRRDLTQMEALRQLGWHVMRLWETDIATDPLRVARKVKTRVLEWGALTFTKG